MEDLMQELREAAEGLPQNLLETVTAYARMLKANEELRILEEQDREAKRAAAAKNY